MTKQVRIAANGRISIPADVRARLGLKDGDTLLLEETEHGLVLSTLQQRVRRVQARFRELTKGKEGFTVDDFLREKREEVRREEERDRALYGE